MIARARRTLEAALPPGTSVWPIGPLAIDDFDEPEPDVLGVVGDTDDCLTDHPHPADTRLLVEVADDTLDFDRRCKGEVYARADITDYWIVNLIDRRLEVYRAPTPDGRCQEIRAYG